MGHCAHQQINDQHQVICGRYNITDTTTICNGYYNSCDVFKECTLGNCDFDELLIEAQRIKTLKEGNTVRCVYKFFLGCTTGTVRIPWIEDSKILTAQWQNEEIVIFVSVPVQYNIPKEYRVLHIIYTGEVEPSGTYIATIQNPDGLVFHVYS
jgi:hypothetical protein